MMPVLALNSIPRTTLAALPVLGLTDIVGIVLYVGGFSFEVAADRQKSAWVEAKRRKEHDEDFLTHGLWSQSRHPNYFVRICASFWLLPDTNVDLGGDHPVDRNCNNYSWRFTYHHRSKRYVTNLFVRL